MIGEYQVITLCGSTRFKKEFLEAQEELTLAGKIVLSVGLFGHADHKHGREVTPQVKEMLDDMHKRKIDLSDGICVINPGDYIGKSTASEIAYAQATGKTVTYRYPHQEAK